MSQRRKLCNNPGNVNNLRNSLLKILLVSWFSRGKVRKQGKSRNNWEVYVVRHCGYSECLPKRVPQRAINVTIAQLFPFIFVEIWGNGHFLIYLLNIVGSRIMRNSIPKTIMIFSSLHSNAFNLIFRQKRKTYKIKTFIWEFWWIKMNSDITTNKFPAKAVNKQLSLKTTSNVHNWGFKWIGVFGCHSLRKENNIVKCVWIGLLTNIFITN